MRRSSFGKSIAGIDTEHLETKSSMIARRRRNEPRSSSTTDDTSLAHRLMS